MSYLPARSKEKIEVGRTDAPLAVLRSHPDFPNTIVPELEGAWMNLNPAWPWETVRFYLSRFEPPCHALTSDLGLDKVEEKDGLKAHVVYVRPGTEPEFPKVA